MVEDQERFTFKVPSLGFGLTILVGVICALVAFNRSQAAIDGDESDLIETQALATCNVKDYEAKGDGSTNDTNAIQAAIDDCANQGGGIVLFPSPGIYISSAINLKDNITLKLDGNDVDDVVIKGLDNSNKSKFIVAEDVNNVGIEGPGTIDRGLGGSPSSAPSWSPYDTWYWKHIVQFIDSTNVTVKDIEITSQDYSPQYVGVHLTSSNCTNVLYDNVIVRANQETNSNDSMQTTNSGRNITIRNSYVYAGDDSVVFHGTLEGTDFDNIVVQDVYIDGENVQGAVMLTTGGQNDPDGSWQTNMTFENITVEDAMSGWSWGHGIAFWPRGPNVHYKNITFRNWEMLGHVPTPFYGVFEYDSGGLDQMTAENIVFDNITIHRTSAYPDQDLQGHGPSVIQYMQSVVFKNITYIYTGGETPPDPGQRRLITFRHIPDLRIGNFKILIDGTPVADPYDYLDFIDCNVTYLDYEVEDLNQDGIVDISDVQLCLGEILGESNPNLSGDPDVNQDGRVNASDVQQIINRIPGP